jgi:eukaryotic translation initiation factor 2C
MTPVSYVSPTYYADRLCERGRLYVRKYFNGDDQGFWDDLNKYKSDLQEKLKGVREASFPRTPHGKTEDEKIMEKKHADDVFKKTRQYVFGRVAKEFYPEWDELDEPKSLEKARNPWSEEIAGTMFWM